MTNRTIDPAVRTSRQTKYATAVMESLREMTHATNVQLLEALQRFYPEVSATTVHRVTSRLKNRGVIGCAPKTTNGSERYDIQPDPHHHFMCANCGELCNIPDSDDVRHAVGRLKEVTGECALAEALTLMGVCHDCNDRKAMR